MSGQYTSNEHYRVYEFDDLYYRENDPNNDRDRLDTSDALIIAFEILFVINLSLE